MGKYCEICNKSTMSGNQISHSHRVSKRSWAPNVQRARILQNGAPKTIHICTRCLRSGKVQRAF